MRSAVDRAFASDLPDFRVDANMFAREIVCSAVLFSHVLAVQIPSLDLGAFLEIISGRHDLLTPPTQCSE
jgi:hypothetical protein